MSPPNLGDHISLPPAFFGSPPFALPWGGWARQGEVGNRAFLAWVRCAAHAEGVIIAVGCPEGGGGVCLHEEGYLGVSSWTKLRDHLMQLDGAALALILLRMGR